MVGSSLTSTGKPIRSSKSAELLKVMLRRKLQAVSYQPTPESRAVRSSSRYDGYEWSGAMKLPESTPG